MLMGTHQSLLSQVRWAQTQNSTLANDNLREAAELLGSVAIREELRLMPVDETGDRLIGAALATRADLLLVDSSRRLDGEHVLLVAGHLAGAMGVALKASLAQTLGATRIEAAALGGWPGGIHGCERVWDIASIETRAQPRRQTMRSSRTSHRDRVS